MNRSVHSGTLGILLVLLLAGATSAYNGYGRYSQFELGVKGGVVLSGLSGNGVDVLEDQLRDEFDVLSDDVLAFAMAGIYGALNFNRCVALQTEVMYQRVGKEYEGEALGSDVDFKIRTDYLTIPVLLKFNLPTNGAIRPHVFAGPHVSFALNATLDDIGDVPAGVDLGYLESLRGSEDIDDEVHNIDGGLTLGAGVDFRAGPGFIVLEGRYMRGFTDVFNAEDLNGNAEEIKNYNFSFMAGYTIQL